MINYDIDTISYSKGQKNNIRLIYSSLKIPSFEVLILLLTKKFIL